MKKPEQNSKTEFRNPKNSQQDIGFALQSLNVA